MNANKKPVAIFICNTSLHIMNSMDACKAWEIEPTQAWMVIKTINNAPPAVLDPVLALASWGRVVWVGDFPVEGRGVLSHWKYQLARYKFHRSWQKKLALAKCVPRIFISYNRMIANRIVASWLCPREIVWLDDGTLSYALALDSVLPPVKKSKIKKQSAGKSKIVSRKKISVNKDKKIRGQSDGKLVSDRGQV